VLTRYMDRWTDRQTDGWMDGWTDRVIPILPPPQTLFAGGIIINVIQVLNIQYNYGVINTHYY